jgi:PAS domain S-box-containing protein
MGTNHHYIKDNIPLEYKELLDIMMRSTADSVFFKDKECRFIYVSDAQLKRLNETNFKNVLGKTDFDFFKKEHAQKAYDSEQEIIKTGIPQLDIEEKTIWANGEVTWNKASRYPLYDRDNNIIGTWGISTEITNQKNVEYQLMEREEHYRILSDVTIEGIVIHKNGIVRDLNPSLLKLLGYEREEILDKNILEYVYIDDRPIAQENILKDFNRPYEIRFTKKSGKQFFAEIEGRTIQLPGEDLRMAAVRDITRRKQAEDALQESETRMRAITDSAHDAIIMMDQNGQISYWNPSAERIFGYTSLEAIGQNLYSLILPSQNLNAQHDALQMFQQTESQDTDGKTLDLEAKRKDNTEISVQLSLSAVQMTSGWHSIGILRDVTKQKQNELELIKAKEIAEEATGAKSEFLANMSHEIRTPMNAIIGFSGLVKNTELTQKQQDYINKIDSSAKSLLSIINDILDFSKIEAGKLELESVEFRLDDVINNIAGMMSAKAAEKNIELLNNITNDVPCALIGDPLRLGQILLNLVNNAVKFTEEGYVLIKTELIEKDDSRCKIKFSVNDTGIGLTNEQKGKMFSAFSQADSTVTRRFGGTGLGLTISKQLVEMMNGEIFVESEFGVGSTFAFFVEFMMQAEGKKKQTVNTESLRGINVLIVDDNGMSREILKDQIGAFGISAVAVDSGPAAILKIKEESERKPYDLVFMDWRMPEMNGIETAKIIFNDKSIKHMPKIIMLSAFGREEVIKKAEKIGINIFLMKPVSQSLLFDTIMNVSEVDAKGFSNESLVRGNEENAIDETDGIDGIRVLLVEDNVLNQEVATEILRSAGAVVAIANNGKEAVDAVNTNCYDVVLMDLQMPIMGGYEATQLIRTDKKNKNLPIIAMTAHAMQGVKAECIAAGMNDYVSKPIHPKYLFSAIKNWVKPSAANSGQQKNKTVEIVCENISSIELPQSISGIDIEAGLDRLNGNRKLYRKLLIDFSENYSSFAEDIKTDMEQGNIEEARRLAHTLKGVAGNISAYDIQNIAAELETNLLKNNMDKKHEILLGKLVAAFESLNQLLSKLDIKTKTEEPNDEKPINPLEVEPVLHKLARLIWEDNVDAENTFEELRKFICGTGFNAEMQALSESISNFDFEAARVPLQKIAEKMNVSLGDQKDE